jgi:hypothetical protein
MFFISMTTCCHMFVQTSPKVGVKFARCFVAWCINRLQAGSECFSAACPYRSTQRQRYFVTTTLPLSSQTTSLYTFAQNTSTFATITSATALRRAKFDYCEFLLTTTLQIHSRRPYPSRFHPSPLRTRHRLRGCVRGGVLVCGGGVTAVQVVGVGRTGIFDTMDY